MSIAKKKKKKRLKNSVLGAWKNTTAIFEQLKTSLNFASLSVASLSVAPLSVASLSATLNGKNTFTSFTDRNIAIFKNIILDLEALYFIAFWHHIFKYVFS